MSEDESAHVPAPLYDGPARLLDWGHQGSRGMWVEFRLVHEAPDGAHPFALIPYGPNNGQRLRFRAMLPTGEPDVPGMPITEGDALLVSWSVTGHRGMACRFQLDDGPDGNTGLNPFFGFELGTTTGEPIEILVHALAEDETLADPRAVRKRRPFHQMTAVAQSGMLATKPDFVRFLADNLATLFPDPDIRGPLEGMRGSPKNFAEATTRAYLGVSSRSVMNQDGPVAAAARMRWLQLLRSYEATTHGIRR